MCAYVRPPAPHPHTVLLKSLFHLFLTQLLFKSVSFLFLLSVRHCAEEEGECLGRRYQNPLTETASILHVG